jgi:heme-degrading monooxygenase HmoA
MQCSEKDEVMIARVWTGWTRTTDAATYEAYMHQVALPDYSGVPGNRGVLMLRRDDPGSERTEFTMLSLWDSLESIRLFAGDDPAVAVFYDRDEEFLVERDMTVRHYTVYGGSAALMGLDSPG